MPTIQYEKTPSVFLIGYRQRLKGGSNRNRFRPSWTPKSDTTNNRKQDVSLLTKLTNRSGTCRPVRDVYNLLNSSALVEETVRVILVMP